VRGDGFLIRRGRIWYARLYNRGRCVEESLRTDDQELAEKRLALLRRKRDRGTYLEPSQRRVTVDELLKDLLVHLEVKGAASYRKAGSALKSVREEFGHRQAHDLDTGSVERVQRDWLKAGVKPATVNRRCELLRQAYRLAARRTPPKVMAIPHVPLLKVENARQGFLSRTQIARLLEGLVDEDVRDFVDWSAWTGMRPSETRRLTWSMVDTAAGTLTVAPAIAKTRRGRVLALVGPLKDIVQRRVQRRRLGCELVFHRVSKGQPGRPVRDIHLAWRAALVAAKLPLTLRPYDLRRSALRNLIRSGTHETVAMAISGHRTRSTFDRYNITSTEDVAAAIERAAAADQAECGPTGERTGETAASAATTSRPVKTSGGSG
jgi:integrase